MGMDEVMIVMEIGTMVSRTVAEAVSGVGEGVGDSKDTWLTFVLRHIER